MQAKISEYLISLEMGISIGVAEKSLCSRRESSVEDAEGLLGRGNC